MKNYTCDVEINASPETVYKALTDLKGLRGWWTEDTQGNSKVGSTLTFRFSEEDYNTMQVEKLVPNQEVHWKCVEQNFSNLEIPDEWVGTTVVFQLKPRGKSGTHLHFEHRGLIPKFKCYDLCRQGWDHFLKTSLKNYIEKGKGDLKCP